MAKRPLYESHDTGKGVGDPVIGGEQGSVSPGAVWELVIENRPERGGKLEAVTFIKTWNKSDRRGVVSQDADPAIIDRNIILTWSTSSCSNSVSGITQ